jgi:hypothetical protein
VIFPRNNAAVGLGTVGFLVLLALLALPLQFQYDGLSASTGIFSVGQTNLTTLLPQHKARVELAPVADWKNQPPSNPSFLRIDYKQNLLVWPVVASDLTRSPPYGVPFQSLS